MLNTKEEKIEVQQTLFRTVDIQTQEGWRYM